MYIFVNNILGKINRKVVKQTVMTVVYGVTFIGGRLQVEKQLKELNIPHEILFRASVYVVQEVFKSLSEMFTSARKIQVEGIHFLCVHSCARTCVNLG